jgi:hypothetical protein
VPGSDWRLRDFRWDRMTAALVEPLGNWAVGWNCAITMAPDGPLRTTGNPPVTTPPETLDRLAAGLVAWHEHLDTWERAVAHLVTALGDRTRYDSGWYSCVTTVLDWFLEALVGAVARGRRVGGRDPGPPGGRCLTTWRPDHLAA